MTDGLALVLAASTMAGGVAHFAAPGYFRSLIPPWMPAPAATVAVTGLFNCAAGVLLAVPATRGAGGWATAGLVTAYLPVHLDALRTAQEAPRLQDRPVAVVARLVVSVGYIACAVAIGLNSRAADQENAMRSSEDCLSLRDHQHRWW
jgi:uncharacterized membrane protein